MILKLHSFLKRTNLYSVRESERLIRSGMIQVNGQIVTDPVFPVDLSCDRVVHNEKTLIIKAHPDIYYIKFYKPKAVVSTRQDPEKRKTIYDFLPHDLPYLSYAGRLDYYSEGLMFFTNDGKLIERLTSPKYAVEKRYSVKLRGKVSRSFLDRLERGIKIDGVKTMPCSIRIVKVGEKHTWTEWKINEGKNRQIRKMCETTGLTVLKLKRMAIGDIHLGNMVPGELRRLTEHELKKLKKKVKYLS